MYEGLGLKFGIELTLKVTLHSHPLLVSSKTHRRKGMKEGEEKGGEIGRSLCWSISLTHCGAMAGHQEVPYPQVIKLESQ